MFHHIPKERHAHIIEEMKRVLRPDGYVFLTEDLVDDEKEQRVTEKIDRLLNAELSANGPHTYRNKQEWIQEFERHGFTLVEEHEEKPDKVRHGFFVFQKGK